jgi:hypothetical protein
MFTRQFYQRVIGSSLALSLGAWGGLSQPTQAVQLADGTISFVQPPRLLKATAPYKSIRFLGASYYFTLNVPEGAGEPLQRVTIAQREAPDTIRFSLDKTQAFADEDRDKEFTLGEVTEDKEAQTISVTFNPPIPPGETVTIRLRARNPDVPGVYLFGVTAFPQGEKVRSQFLGYGRLHFYGGNGDSSFLFSP